jgi:hypothetical protein
MLGMVKESTQNALERFGLKAKTEDWGLYVF